MKKLAAILLSFAAVACSFAAEIDSSKKPSHASKIRKGVSKRVEAFDAWHNKEGHARGEVIPELQKWEDQDYRAHLKAAEGNEFCQSLFDKLHQTWSEAYAAGRMSYLNNTLIYYGYSLVLSNYFASNEDVSEDDKSKYGDEVINLLTKAIIDYVGKGIPSKDNKLLEPISVQDERLRDYYKFGIHTINDFIQGYEKVGLTYLSFSSKSGLSRHRAINHAAAMKAPIIGHPLTRAGFDGVSSSFPAEFASYDLNQCFFRTSPNYSDDLFDFTYDAYTLLDKLVAEESSEDQPLLDAVLYLLGHEDGFKADLGFDFEKSLPKGFLTGPLNREHFEKMIDLSRDIRIKNLKNIVEKQENRSGFKTLQEYLEAQRRMPQPCSFAGIREEDWIKTYHRSEMPSVVEYIKEKNLPTDRPLEDHEEPDLLATTLEIKFSEYNMLFDLKNVFEKSGLKFDIWIDGEFNVKGLEENFLNIFNTFKNRFKDKIPE